MLSIASRVSASFFALVFISGCATGSGPIATYSLSDNLAALNGFKKIFLKTSRFTLTAYTRISHLGNPIHIYIEGDGVSWVSRTQLSDDPTPRKPLVLELAAMDASPNIAYLARPGQYSESGKPECDSSYWSDSRFSKEVVDSMNEAVENLAHQAGTEHIHLIGFSGGAAIAVLVASNRHDIDSLRTIAGNLDPDAVNKYHHVTRFKNSLNPIDVAEEIRNIPQRHFIGSSDRVVPLSVIESFVRREGDKDDRRITLIDGVGHTKGWQEKWKKELYSSVF